MNTDIASLQAFVCVAEQLHFGRAATLLHMSPSRLTRLVQSLERAVGTQLLGRTTHATVLTTQGAEFLLSARRIVAEAEWVDRQFRRQVSGSAASFTVGCMAGTLYEGLPGRIRAARVSYPQTQIRLLGMPEGEVARLVTDGTLDMGFLYFPVPDDVLSLRVVSRRSQWVAMAPDHPLAGSTSLGVRELAGHNLILPDPVAAPRLHHWYKEFLEKGGSNKLQFISANDLVAALGLCAAGEGLCIVAEHLKRARSDDLQYVPLRGAPRTELFAIWRNDSPVRHIAQFVSRW